MEGLIRSGQQLVRDAGDQGPSRLSWPSMMCACAGMSSTRSSLITCPDRSPQIGRTNPPLGKHSRAHRPAPVRNLADGSFTSRDDTSCRCVWKSVSSGNFTTNPPRSVRKRRTDRTSTSASRNIAVDQSEETPSVPIARAQGSCPKWKAHSCPIRAGTVSCGWRSNKAAYADTSGP